MIEYQKRPDTSGKFKTVKYDKRIEFVPPFYIAMLDTDAGITIYYKGCSFTIAQRSLEHLPSDVYEGPEVPFSVFHGGFSEYKRQTNRA